mmetsp:Transcript_63030/g.140382  ORF Transcript_63030/g.140382 Transcript_63030/m.140382 type:complete len:252 (-) Transcript_63030:168-923(-)
MNCTHALPDPALVSWLLLRVWCSGRPPRLVRLPLRLVRHSPVGSPVSRLVRAPLRFVEPPLRAVRTSPGLPAVPVGRLARPVGRLRGGGQFSAAGEARGRTGSPPVRLPFRWLSLPGPCRSVPPSSSLCELFLCTARPSCDFIDLSSLPLLTRPPLADWRLRLLGRPFSEAAELPNPLRRSVFDPGPVCCSRPGRSRAVHSTDDILVPDPISCRCEPRQDERRRRPVVSASMRDASSFLSFSAAEHGPRSR